MQVKSESVQARLAVICKRRGLHWREVAVLLVLTYFTPIGGTRAGTFHFPLVIFSHSLAIGVLLAWMVYRLRQGRWLPRTPLDLPLAAFYLLSMISTLLSTEPRLSLENFIHLTLFALIYYLAVDLLLDGWTASALIKPMLLVGAVIILAELLELALWLGIWFVGTGEVSPLLTLGGYRRRIIMGPANVLAWYLVLLIPLAVSQLMTAGALKARANLQAWIAGGFLVFASTLSRSGLVGMGVALATYGLLITVSHVRSGDGTLRSLVGRPAVIAAAVLTVLTVVALGALAVSLVSTRLYTVLVRFELWRAAAELIARHPLLGGGPGTFGYLFHQVPDFDLSIPDTYYNNAHNSFINIAAESGLPSLLAGLWLVAVLARTGLRRILDPDRRSAGAQVVNSACLAGITGLLAAMLFDVPWVFPVITLYVVLLAAIIVAPYSQPRQSVVRPLRWLPAAALSAMAATLFWSDSAHYFQHQAIGAVKMDNMSAGVRYLQRSTTIDPFFSIYQFQLGIAKGYLGLETGNENMLREAIEAFQAEISRGGNTAINNANLAWLESSTGDAEGAIAHMTRAAGLAPADGYYQLGLAYLLEEAGQPEAALEAYGAAIRATPALSDSGFWHVNETRQGFKANSLADETLPALTTASLAYSMRDYDRALRVLGHRSSSVSADLLRGQIETARGEYDEALEHLNTALAKAGQSPAVFLARGKLYLHLGDEANARRDFRIANLLGLSEASIPLGEIAYQNGDLQKAISLYQGSIPMCRRPSAGYDYASHVYHRLDLKADFWPDTITCLPYDSLVPEYLHFVSAYRRTGQSEEADDLCSWLMEFYEPSVLRQLYDESSDGWPCPDRTT